MELNSTSQSRFALQDSRIFLQSTDFLNLFSKYGSDCGWYGKGIYFTTYAMYSLPYFGTRSNPAIIISYVVPGNIFPVTESPNGKKSLSGYDLLNLELISFYRAGMMPSYNSHYVLVNSTGSIPEYQEQLFDELVIPQESQISPAYVVRVSTEGLPKALKRWTTRRDRERSTKGKSTDEKDNSALSSAMQPLEVDESNMRSVPKSSRSPFPLRWKSKK